MTKSEQEWSGSVQETSQGREGGDLNPAEVDGEGVPLMSSVGSWPGLAGIPRGTDALAEIQLLLAALRFSRGDGTSVFGPRGRQPARVQELRSRALRLGDASLAGVVGRLLKPDGSGSLGPTSPLPVGSYCRADRPLAVMRPDWSPRGDLVAIDHRASGSTTQLEVGSKGRVWLGPTWASTQGDGTVGPPGVTSWASNPYAECVEWSYRVGETRVSRTALLLKGQGAALLAQEDEGPGPAIEARFAIPEAIEAIPDPALRCLTLSSGRGRSVARLIPLGLPCSPYRTERGSIEVEGRTIVVRQVSDGPRRWLGVLITWERAASSWRTLTVASKSEACPGDVAFAARVAWKQRGGTLVVYRSLGPPELRTFLGHQTRARFLVGSFDPLGDVRPLLKLD